MAVADDGCTWTLPGVLDGPGSLLEAVLTSGTAPRVWLSVSSRGVSITTLVFAGTATVGTVAEATRGATVLLVVVASNKTGRTCGTCRGERHLPTRTRSSDCTAPEPSERDDESIGKSLLGSIGVVVAGGGVKAGAVAAGGVVAGKAGAPLAAGAPSFG